MSEQILYPFCAIVGQERMKRALILNIINPALGGVLIPVSYTHLTLLTICSV